MNGRYLHKQALVFILSCLVFSVLITCVKIVREPKVLTGALTGISMQSAVAEGNLIDLGEGITVHGHCWSIIPNPETFDSKTSLGPKTSTGTFTSNLTGLQSDTKYYIRAYARQGELIVYGDETSFTTKGYPPEAAFNGSPTTIAQGQSVQFTDQSTNSPTEWQWNFGDGETSNNQNTSHIYTNAGPYTVSLTATNNSGSDTETKPDYIIVKSIKAYNWYPSPSPVYLGDELSVLTDIVNGGEISYSYVLTAEIYDGNTQIAYLGQKTTALILPGYSQELTFSYTIPMDWEPKNYSFRIVVWSGTPFSSLILDDDSEPFTVEPIPLTVTDADGNIYNTVTIGSQVWMAENLKTTKFSNGSDILLVPGNTDWSNQTTPAYCWYENNQSNKEIYGGLYNWYAVNTGNLCPTGWHVPSDSEWTDLANFLEGDGVAGGKLKETGTEHWENNNGATNETGFTALPGGFRYEGVFSDIRLYGYWWSSLGYNDISAWHREIDGTRVNLFRYTSPKNFGLSVRCIKN